MAIEKSEAAGNGYPSEQRAIEDEIQLVDFIYPLFKRRWFIIWFMMLATVAGGLLAFLSTRIYESQAIIMPESGGSDSVANLQSVVAQQFGIALPSTKADPAVLFNNVLTSRSFAERIVERLNLTELVLDPTDDPGIIPTSKLQQETAKYLLEEVVKINVDTSKGSTISITVQEDDPILAAHIANTYVAELERYNRESNITKAKRLRLFLEERLDQANQELSRAQRELRTFQEQHKALSISEQAKQTLTTLANLEAKKLELQIQLAAQAQFVRESHTQVKALQSQIDAIQKNIDKLKYASVMLHTPGSDDGSLEYYIPLDQVPLLAFQENRLLLEVGTKSKVVELLTAQLEQAKLDEAREFSTITVLEPAIVAEEPVKPKVKLILALAGVLGILGGVMLAFVVTYFEQETQDTEHGSKWEEMRQGIRRDLRQMVRLGKGSLWIFLILLLSACDKLPFWKTSTTTTPVQLPVSLLAAGYGNGVYQTTDGGQSWRSLALGQIDFAHYVKVLALNPLPSSTLYIGTTGQGLYQVSLDTEKGPMPLHRLKETNVKAILADPVHPEQLYVATWGQGVMRSQDGGQSWESFNEGLLYLYVRTLAIAPVTPFTLYAGTIGGVFRYHEGQKAWESISQGLNVPDVKALAIDPQNPDILYAGTRAHTEWGSLYRTTNGGKSWEVLKGGPKKVTVFTIVLDPGERRRILVGTGNGVMVSRDGQTWEDWSTGLPKAPVYSIVLTKTPVQAVFAATHGGVYRRLEGEETWLPVRYGLEGEMITSLIPAPVADSSRVTKAQ